jgi:heme/copper-type cytochrome/quinol oxidase subunit 2
MKKLSVLLGLAAVALIASGCESAFPPPAVTDEALEIRDLYNLVFAVAAVVFVLVQGLIIWSVIRYRRKPGDSTLPVQTHGNLALEIIWTVIPLIVVIALFFAFLVVAPFFFFVVFFFFRRGGSHLVVAVAAAVRGGRAVVVVAAALTTITAITLAAAVRGRRGQAGPAGRARADPRRRRLRPTGCGPR